MRINVNVGTVKVEVTDENGNCIIGWASKGSSFECDIDKLKVEVMKVVAEAMEFENGQAEKITARLLDGLNSKSKSKS